MFVPYRVSVVTYFIFDGNENEAVRNVSKVLRIVAYCCLIKPTDCSSGEIWQNIFLIKSYEL